MKVDLNALPPPLDFGAGESAFKLHLRPLEGSDSAMCLDAVGGGSYSEMFHAAGRLVIGWENVEDKAGAPIPFEKLDEKTNRPVCQLNRFLGAIQMVDRLRVLGGIMAFVGIPPKDLLALIEQFEKAAVDLDPTQTPDVAMRRRA